MNRLLIKSKKYAGRFSKKGGGEPTNESEELLLVPSDNDKEDALTASLHNLMPEDIEVKKNAGAKKSRSVGFIVRRVILIISCTVFVLCAVYLAYNLIDKKRGADFYNSVANEWGDDIFDEENDVGDGAVARLRSLKSATSILCLKDRIAAGSNPGGITYDAEIEKMRSRLTSLGEKFPDLYGWISIAGTAINLPVVQGEDNDFYLSSDPSKSPLINGSIFVDYHNNKEIIRNFNTVLYGHNLTGGGMFHDVQRFYENEDLFMNTNIYIYTMDGAYVYEPFAVYDTRSDYHYFRTEFSSAEEFVEFAYEMQSNSIYKKDMEFVPTDRIITLSTCTNREYWGRYALQAKLVQVIH